MSGSKPLKLQHKQFAMRETSISINLWMSPSSCMKQNWLYGLSTYFLTNPYLAEKFEQAFEDINWFSHRIISCTCIFTWNLITQKCHLQHQWFVNFLESGVQKCLFRFKTIPFKLLFCNLCTLMRQTLSDSKGDSFSRRARLHISLNATSELWPVCAFLKINFILVSNIDIDYNNSISRTIGSHCSGINHFWCSQYKAMTSKLLRRVHLLQTRTGLPSTFHPANMEWKLAKLIHKSYFLQY